MLLTDVDTWRRLLTPLELCNNRTHPQGKNIKTRKTRHQTVVSKQELHSDRYLQIYAVIAGSNAHMINARHFAYVIYVSWCKTKSKRTNPLLFIAEKGAAHQRPASCRHGASQSLHLLSQCRRRNVTGLQRRHAMLGNYIYFVFVRRACPFINSITSANTECALKWFTYRQHRAAWLVRNNSQSADRRPPSLGRRL